MEILINGGSFETQIDEQVIFNQLDNDESAIHHTARIRFRGLTVFYTCLQDRLPFQEQNHDKTVPVLNILKGDFPRQMS